MHVEQSVEIEAPREVVWRVAQDPQLRPRWDCRTARYEIHGGRQAGTAVSYTVKMGFLRLQGSGILLRWNAPHQSALQNKSVLPLLPLGAGSWTFTETTAGTRFTTRFAIAQDRLPWWVPRRLYQRLVEWDTRRSLHRLRRLVTQMSAAGLQES